MTHLSPDNMASFVQADDNVEFLSTSTRDSALHFEVMKMNNGSTNTTDIKDPSPPCRRILYSTIGDSPVRIWDVMILVPNILFLFYLIMKLRYVIPKLRKNPSPMFAVCFTLVCLANVISLLRCIVSMSIDSNDGDYVDRVLWLLLKFFLLAIELSVIVFGFMFGHLDTRRSIQRVLAVTFAISLAYSLTQGVLEFVMPNEQFHNISMDTGRSFSLYGHGGIIFFLASSTVLCLVYLTICLLPFTALRYRFAIPMRKSFYVYCLVLGIHNLLQSIGCALFTFWQIPHGWCLIDATTYAYFTLFAPLLYLTFLRSFFAASARPSVLFSYRSQIDEGPEDMAGGADSPLPYPASFYGPPRDTSINYNTGDESDSGAGHGAGGAGLGWQDLLVGVPELKQTDHSSHGSTARMFVGPTSLTAMARNTDDRA